MENKNNALAIAEENTIIGNEDFYCSFEAITPEEKAQLFEIMNNPAERLADNINKTIYVKDIYCEIVDCVNEETGEVTKAPRVVLIDKDNVGYQAVSTGIFSAIKKLFMIYGEPTWEEPIPIEIKQIKKGKKSLLTFNIKTN